MLIHQGWFTALYTQHLLDSQSFALNMPLIRCTNVFFPREAIPSHYFPLREDSSRVLAWELHGYSGPAVVIIPPLPPNVTNSRAEATANPVSGKTCSSTNWWFTALYTQHLLESQVSSLNVFFQGRLSRHNKLEIIMTSRTFNRKT